MTAPQALTVKGKRRRDQLLAAALQVISERGYAGASQRVIAQAAGVPAASTHYFFDSMHDLAQQAATVYLHERVAVYQAMIEAMATQQRPAQDWVGEVVATLDEVPAERRLAQFEIYLNAARYPELAVLVGECLTQLRELVVQWPELCEVPDPDAWASAVLALGDGFALHQVAGQPVSRADAERALTALVTAAREG